MLHLNLDDTVLKAVKGIEKDAINKIIEIALEQDNITNKNIYVSIECISKNEIRQLNKEYRNVDKETDVLSFPIFTKEELKDIKFDQIELGDIVICIDVVKEQSIEYDTGMKRELLYMITHGICHLLGYDHEIVEDKIIMRAKEEKILNMIGASK
ncbi:MAG: rRNA maturation RNase YbeY [Clostridia bacterium]|nr:rRNA maturation RNase YbeY [Clostridia bacterium]MDD4387155.1 rRNA maturation RNase YbeY [Clostridia bacterium]